MKDKVDKEEVVENSEHLDLCGCVDEEYIEDIITVLKECANKDFYISHICERTGFDYKYVLSILCWLDHLEFIEHGTAIRGSWIIDKGQEFLKKIVTLPG